MTMSTLLEGSQVMEYHLGLGQAYYQNYGRTHRRKDLEFAILVFKNGLDNCLDGTGCLLQLLNNLGSALRDHYEHFGGLESLEEAIIFHRQALELCPPGHPDRALSLDSLGRSLTVHFEQHGEIEDLRNAISYLEEALVLALFDYPDKCTSLNNLGRALKIQYEQLGDLKDLEKAIHYHGQAVCLSPLGHTLRSYSLSNLAIASQIRYELLEEMADLDKSITCHEEALSFCPPGHYLRPPFLSNLANALHARYKQQKDIEDLEKAITCHREGLAPPGHALRPSSLNNLAITLQARYKRFGEIEDLEEAITCHEEALDLRRPGHPLRSSSLNNLAICLCTRYKQLGDMENLERSIDYHKQALELRPPGHPLRSASLNNLGYTFYMKYQKLENDEYVHEAIDFYKQAAFTISKLPDQLLGAKKCATIAHKHEFNSAIPAYSLALSLLQHQLSLLPSITSQQKVVEKSSHLCLDAAACAIATGAPDVAIELLEQGRSILWSKLQRYRQSFDDVSKKAPQLAQEFQAVYKQLEMNAVNMDVTLQLSLFEKWTTLLGEIRKLDGFSNFLQPTPYEVLQNAATKGPVIMVNISQFRSDAIIIIEGGSPLVVPLQEYLTSPEILRNLVNQLSRATTSPNSNIVYKILQHLWYAIVEPVVGVLARLNIPEKSHIWWCPTSYLCALPLHAAGLYRKGIKNLPDLYISSYILTLASLIKAQSDMCNPQSPMNLLLISQPDETIPHVFEEGRVICGINIQVKSCSGYDADKGSVLTALQSHPWVHFACHGHLEDQPFNSWIQLHNREHLTVLDLAKAHFPNAEFAFLSACHSAAGNVYKTPDESIHLAGALQFSGFRGVIGTLWAMIDDDGPSITSIFYKYMFNNPERVDLRNAAAALNFATKELRKQNVPVERWINFIHIGA